MKSLTAGIFLAAALVATASAETVNSTGLGWVVVPHSTDIPGSGTFGLPADLTSIGCGTENETTCEPTGVFTLGSNITSATGYYTIDDGVPGASGGASDYVILSGNQILFYSDPNSNPDVTGLTNLGVACFEGTSGCASAPIAFTTANSVAAGTLLTMEVASDAEVAFDPFGFGFDTSDQIRFTGEDIVVTATPEPSTFMLIGSGLLGLGLMRRRNASK